MILKIIYALFFTSLISIKTNCQETTGDFIIEFVRDSSEENVYWIKNKKFNGEIAKLPSEIYWKGDSSCRMFNPLIERVLSFLYAELGYDFYTSNVSDLQINNKGQMYMNSKNEIISGVNITAHAESITNIECLNLFNYDNKYCHYDLDLITHIYYINEVLKIKPLNPEKLLKQGYVPFREKFIYVNECISSQKRTGK